MRGHWAAPRIAAAHLSGASGAAPGLSITPTWLRAGNGLTTLHLSMVRLFIY